MSSRYNKHVLHTIDRYHDLQESRIRGDWGAIDTLLDFEQAVQKAKLSDRQAHLLEQLKIFGITDYYGIKMLSTVEGTTQQNIRQRAKRLVTRIAKAYDESEAGR